MFARVVIRVSYCATGLIYSLDTVLISSGTDGRQLISSESEAD